MPLESRIGSQGTNRKLCYLAPFRTFRLLARALGTKLYWLFAPYRLCFFLASSSSSYLLTVKQRRHSPPTPPVNFVLFDFFYLGRMTMTMPTMRMNNNKPSSSLILLLSSLALLLIAGGFNSNNHAFVDAASKVKRVKAGKVYQDHDAVHIVVNKVG